MHLSECEAHYPAELSGGMQQRVGLARTFITDPDLLLLDEPFSALDPIIRKDLQDQFTRLCRDLQKTAVFITHDFAEAVRVGDRIGVMKDGKIIQIGAPREIVLNPSSDYVASFSSDIPKSHYLNASDVLKLGQKEPGPERRELAAPLPMDAPLGQIIAILGRDDVAIPIVDAQGRVAGTITRDALIRFIGQNATDFTMAAPDAGMPEKARDRPPARSKDYA
jgi:glycine betaine/proline transport system ATP-binding protein